MATSTAVAPSSEKKTCSSPGGARSTSRLASRMVVGFDDAQRRDVGHAIELLADGGVDPRMAVPVDVAPQAADAVEVLAAVDVHQHAALGPLEDQRLVLGHLREGVPDKLAIPSLELFNNGERHVRWSRCFRKWLAGDPDRHVIPRFDGRQHVVKHWLRPAPPFLQIPLTNQLKSICPRANLSERVAAKHGGGTAIGWSINIAAERRQKIAQGVSPGTMRKRGT